MDNELELLKTILNIYSHEVAQLVLMLRGNNDLLRNPKEFKRLSEDKITAIYFDNKNTLNFLNMLNKNIMVLIGREPIRIHNDDINVYESLINWNNLFERHLYSRLRKRERKVMNKKRS